MRTFLPLGIAAWLVLEIWLLIVVASAAGGLAVLLLLVAGVVLGAAVIRSAARRARRNLIETLQSGGGPADPAASKGNGVVVFGGVLLMVPGLISDVAGLLCLLPRIRALLSRRFDRLLFQWMARRAQHPLADGSPRDRMGRRGDKVIRGEVIRDDETQDPPDRS
jgi:UPF0716 protein FxsA